MSDGDKSPQIPSRLARRAAGPTRGLGSGFAANQRLAGAADPEAAAAAAATPEEVQRAQAKEEEKVVENVQGKVHEIMEGLRSGWQPELKGFTAQRPQTLEAWQAFLDTQTAEVILEVYEELQVAINESIDQQTDQQAQMRMREQLGIDPTSHLYDPISDTARRLKIEEHLEPLDIADMIFQGYVRQHVPLGNGLTLTLRSIPTIHGLWMEWYIGRVAEDSTVQHVRHLLSVMQLAAGLDEVNGKPTGPDLTKYMKEGHRDNFIKALTERLEFIGRWPQDITNDFIVQNVWFSGRIRKTLAGNLMEKVGNS